MTKTTDPIIIVGAGPAGLVLAYLLASEGIPVRVFESHKDFEREFRGEFLQPSGMKILDELDLISDLNKTGSVIPVTAVRMHFKERLVSTTESNTCDPAGFLVHQPSFLEALIRRCCNFNTFQLDMNSPITGFTFSNGRVDGVLRRHASEYEERIRSRFVVVCNGRLSALRAKVGLTETLIEPVYSIIWHRFDMSRHQELMPTSLDGFVGSRALCVVFPTHGTRLQVMWRRRPGYELDWGSPPDILYRELLKDLPPHWRDVVAQVIDKRVERQTLKVVSDRLSQWWSHGVLFIGDAAHSMSPIGGQGLAMAIRDAVVAANQIIRTHRSGDTLGDPMCAQIQRERTTEIKKVQQFQAQAAKLHIATPAAQWVIARIVIPLATKVRGKSYMDALQNGYSNVQVEY